MVEIVTQAIDGKGWQADVTVDSERYSYQVTVPDDLAEALAGDDAARTTFEALPYSHRQRHVLAIDGAKAPETRARRIDKALAMLREGRR